MDGYDSIIEEIRTRTKTKRLHTAFLRAEFHRNCVTHYTNTVLPQIELFEDHLIEQRVSIIAERLHQLDENVLRASLEVRHGIVLRVLQFRYDYRSKDLSFLQTNGSDRNAVVCSQSFVNFDKLTAKQVYDILAEFVRSIFKLEDNDE